MVHSLENSKRIATNIDYPHYYKLILSEKSGSSSLVLLLRQKKFFWVNLISPLYF